MMMSLKKLCFAVAVAASAGGSALAAVPREDFPLGQSAQSGAVCTAVRDWGDLATARPGERAWQVKCRGWTQTLGHIYLFQQTEAVTAPAGAWRASLNSRADCDFGRVETLKSVPGSAVAACKSKPNGAKYVAYSVTRGATVAAADGFAPIGDIIATGLQVAAGQSKAPATTAAQTGAINLAEVFNGQIEGLNAAADTAGSGAENQREAAYRQSQVWQFEAAESGFSGLAAVPGATAHDRAEAYLNLALAVSNSGRFDEADSYFSLGDQENAKAKSASLTALSLNYQAAHARNQRHFEAAIELARKAVAQRPATDADSTQVALASNGAPIVSDAAAEALNSRGRQFNSHLASFQLESIRNAQALQIEGTSEEALGREQDARRALQRARDILAQPFSDTSSLASGSPWLAARVNADLERLDRNTPAAAQALRDLQITEAAFNRRYPGSLASGGLLIELANAQAASGADDQALATYERAFKVFASKRGALGPSADLIGPYFDILLRRIGKDPGAQKADTERFFNAAQVLISASTAAAATQFTARMSEGGSAAAAISRGRDDTLRLIDLKQQEIRELQQSGAFTGTTKDRTTADLNKLRKDANGLEQELLEANPRYGTMLNSDVSLAQLQEQLTSGQSYVKIFLLADRGYGMFITRTEARPYPIDLNRASARELATKLRTPFDQVAATGRLARYDVDLAHKLFLKLFQPVMPQMMATQRLVYEPDATLVGVPVGALVVDDDSVATMKINLQAAIKARTVPNYVGVHWLGAKMESALSVSTSAFVQGRKLAASKAPKPFIGFGDPVLNGDSQLFSSVGVANGRGTAGRLAVCDAMRSQLMALRLLPDTADEIRVVSTSLRGDSSDTFLGGAFTDSGVRKLGQSAGGLDQYRVLYFATHGVLPPTNGCMSPALVTSLGDATSDGLLDQNEIWDLKLDADMVVLSACDTGGSNGSGATINSGGEALGGLVRAFIYAGARNLVVSNWKVDSSATARLMASMFQAGKGTQGEALATAQRAMINSPDQYSHPFFWAAFSLVGDGERAMPQS